MSDRRLQVFHSVARHLSFTKAAEALHMTQPAVTFQVRQLEEQFNTRLFDRTHNRISLTEAGDRVYHYAKQIFELYSRMEGEVRELTGGVSGVVILGASTTIAEYMLPSLLGAFKRKFPDVVIRLQVSNTEGIVAMVEDNAIDHVISNIFGSKINPKELFKQLSNDFELGLKLVRDKTGRNRFFITRDALLAPDKFIEGLIKDNIQIGQS